MERGPEEEISEREDLVKRLKKKNKQLKKEVKEYQVLTRVIQQENKWFKAQSSNLQQEIRKLKRKNKKLVMPPCNGLVSLNSKWPKQRYSARRSKLSTTERVPQVET